MSPRSGKHGKGKAVNRSTDWSEWQWDNRQRQYFKHRLNSLGEPEYAFDVPRIENVGVKGRETQYASSAGNIQSPVGQIEQESRNKPSSYEANGGTYPLITSTTSRHSGNASGTGPPTNYPQGGGYNVDAQNDYNPQGRETSTGYYQGSVRSASHYNPGNVGYGGDYYNPERPVDALAAGLSQTSISTSGLAYPPPDLNRHIMATNSQSNVERLDPRYRVEKAARFFTVGRIFKVLWPEPAGGSPASDEEDADLVVHNGKYSERIYSKVRNFVVVREPKNNRGHCLCLPLATYGGQGTLKRGLNQDDFAAVFDKKLKKAYLRPGEELQKHPFPVEVEDDEKLDRMTRLNFSKVYTVECNVKVLKTGRIPSSEHKRLLRYFAESMPGPDLSAPQRDPETVWGLQVVSSSKGETYRPTSTTVYQPSVYPPPTGASYYQGPPTAAASYQQSYPASTGETYSPTSSYSSSAMSQANQPSSYPPPAASYPSARPTSTASYEQSYPVSAVGATLSQPDPSAASTTYQPNSYVGYPTANYERDSTQVYYGAPSPSHSPKT